MKYPRNLKVMNTPTHTRDVIVSKGKNREESLVGSITAWTLILLIVSSTMYVVMGWLIG